PAERRAGETVEGYAPKMQCERVAACHPGFRFQQSCRAAVLKCDPPALPPVPKYGWTAALFCARILLPGCSLEIPLPSGDRAPLLVHQGEVIQHRTPVRRSAQPSAYFPLNNL